MKKAARKKRTRKVTRRPTATKKKPTPSSPEVRSFKGSNVARAIPLRVPIRLTAIEQDLLPPRSARRSPPRRPQPERTRRKRKKTATTLQQRKRLRVRMTRVKARQPRPVDLLPPRKPPRATSFPRKTTSRKSKNLSRPSVALVADWKSSLGNSRYPLTKCPLHGCIGPKASSKWSSSSIGQWVDWVDS